MLFFILIAIFSNVFVIAHEEPHHTTAFINFPGVLDSLVSYSHYSTNHFWNRHEERLSAYNEFKENSGFVYSEYAINNSNSIFLHAGYSKATETMNGNCQGIHDVELGWKNLLLVTCDSALTLQLEAVIPAGRKKSSLRYGQWAFQPTLLFSKKFLDLWADFGIGYRGYHGFPSDQFRSFFAIGYHVSKCCIFIATNELILAVGNGDAEKNLNNIKLHPNHSLYKVKFEVVFDIFQSVYGSLGVFRHIWGRNIGAEGGIFLGLWISN